MAKTMRSDSLNVTYNIKTTKKITIMEKNDLKNVKPVVKTETEIKVEEYDYCFNLVTDEKGTRIAVGRTIVSDKVFATKDEAKAYIDSKPWGLLMATAHVCMKIFEENKNNK